MNASPRSSAPLSTAGRGADPQVALQSAAVWACCRLISESISALPAHVYEEQKGEGKLKAFRHPLYRLLTKSPNPLMTFPQWIQTTVLHLLLYGNAFTYPETFDGETIALYPFDPARMQITFDRVTGAMQYTYTDVTGKPKNYDPLSLLHFRIFSLDGLIGLSPVDFHRMTVDFESAAMGYAASLYRNGGRPSGVLEYPGPLKREQVDQIRENWNTIHTGEGAGVEVAILSNGTKYQAISLPLQQLEYIQQQKLSTEQIARIYGVPPHLIGASDSPTYASVEQQGLEFLQYTIQPIVVGLERTIEMMLLEAPFIYRLNLAAYQRSDIKSRYSAYAVGRQWGWLSANDVRALEEMNGIGAQGDVYVSPLNMIPATDLATTAQDDEQLTPQGVTT